MGAKKRCRKKVKKKEVCHRPGAEIKSKGRKCKHFPRLGSSFDPRLKLVRKRKNKGEDTNEQPRFIRESRDVSNRHKALALLHNQMVGLEVRFQEDVFRLEERYAREFYAPMQALRRALIERRCRKSPFCEEVLLQQCKACFPKGCGQFHELEMHVKCLQEQGIPSPPDCCGEFWLAVMLRSDAILRKRIQPWDTEVLRFLTDVRVVPIRVNRATPLACQAANDTGDVTAVGFDLLFEFRRNPYFTNAKLIKRYVIDILPDRHDYVMAPHHDVASLDNSSEEWDADCEDSDDSTSRCSSRKHCDVDKLLDYTGPQVIAIRGGYIQWTGGRGCSRALVRSLCFCSTPHNCSCANSTTTPPASTTTSPASATTSPASASTVPSLDSSLFSASDPSSTISPTTSTEDNCFTQSHNPALTPSAKPPQLHPQNTSSNSSSSRSSSGSQNSPLSLGIRSSGNHLSSCTNSTPLPSRFPSSTSADRSTSRSPHSELARRSAQQQKSWEFPGSSYHSIPSSLTGSTTDLNRIADRCIHSQSGVTSLDSQVNVILNWRKNDPQTQRKSFFDFFDLTWTEKSREPRHKDVLRDYQLGSYIREILIPRAYLLFRRKNIKEPPSDCHANHISSRHQAVNKPTTSSEEQNKSSSYDDIDDDIPLELSKQALRNIQSCQSVKSEIFRRNKEIAARIARSALGQVMRRHSNTSQSSTTLSTSQCATEGGSSDTIGSSILVTAGSPTTDCDVDDVIMNVSSGASSSARGTSQVAVCCGSSQDDVIVPSSGISVSTSSGGGETGSGLCPSMGPVSNRGHLADNELDCWSGQSGYSVNRAFERIKYDVKRGKPTRGSSRIGPQEATESPSLPQSSSDDIRGVIPFSTGEEGGESGGPSTNTTNYSASRTTESSRGKWSWSGTPSSSESDDNMTETLKKFAPHPTPSSDKEASTLDKPFPSFGVGITEDKVDSDSEAPPPPSVEDSCKQQ